MRRTKLYSGVFVIITLILFIYVSSIGITNIIRYNGDKKVLQEMQGLLAKEQMRNKVLISQQAQLSRPNFWEYLAKKKLNYVHKNEVVYKIIRKH